MTHYKVDAGYDIVSSDASAQYADELSESVDRVSELLENKVIDKEQASFILSMQIPIRTQGLGG